MSMYAQAMLGATPGATLYSPTTTVAPVRVLAVPVAPAAPTISGSTATVVAVALVIAAIGAAGYWSYKNSYSGRIVAAKRPKASLKKRRR